MTEADFESLKRGLQQAVAYTRGEQTGCKVHHAKQSEGWGGD